MHERGLVTEGVVSRGQTSGEPADLPLTFGTILADPPWEVLQKGAAVRIATTRL